MSPVQLPPEIHDKLESLQRKVTRLASLRGACVVAVVALLSAGLMVTADALIGLPRQVRFVGLISWLTLIGATAFACCWRPARRRIAESELAAAIEEQYPKLGERLTSSVELAGHSEEHHGAPNLVRLLVRETELKTRAMDFSSAASPVRTEIVAVAAGVLVTAAVVSALVWQDRFGPAAQRFLMPWAADRLPFDVLVSPGSTAAAKGRPLTISAMLTQTNAKAKPPSVLTLVVTPPEGRPQRIRMTANAGGAFVHRISEVRGDFHYEIEADGARGETYAIQAIDPVELAAGSPRLTVKPPAYANAQVPKLDQTGTQDASAIAHSQVTWEWSFDRPANDVQLAPIEQDDANVPDLKWSPDRKSVRLEWSPSAGRYPVQLKLLANHGVATDVPRQVLTVNDDKPPQFVRTTGFPLKPRDIQPTDMLNLDLQVADDIAVQSIEIEYRVNGGPVQSEAVKLPGVGSPLASGPHGFRFADRVKDGDRVEMRLKAVDNRNLPELKLVPQEATFPAGNQWSEVRIRRKGQEQIKQEIAKEQDDTEQRLRDLVDAIKKENRAIYGLAEDVNRNERTSAEQQRSVEALQKQHEANERKLEEFAQDAEAAPGMQPLADAARQVAKDELAQARENLKQAAEKKGRERVPPLQSADRQTDAATRKLEQLLELNKQLAKDRQDEAKLRDLAEQQAELAKQAEKQPTPEEVKELEEKQKELAKELQDTAQKNESLRNEMNRQQAEKLDQLADKARELAKEQREIDRKQTSLDEMRRNEVAQKQKDLAERMEKFKQENKQTSEAAKSQPPKTEPAKQAADELAKSQMQDAAKHQDEAAKEMERAAKELNKAAELARDPKEAAKQLARKEEANRNALKNTDFNKPSAAENFEQVKKTQEAIREAAKNLDMPPNAPDQAKQAQDNANKQLDAAKDALDKGNRKQADEAMQKARQALDKLADQMPGNSGEQSAKQPPSDQSPAGENAKAAEKASELAKEQRELQREAAQIGRNQESPEGQRQQAVQSKTDELSKDLQKSSQQTQGAAKQQAQRATQSSQQANDSMNQANGAPSPSAAHMNREQAADALDQAAQQASRAAEAARRQAGQTDEKRRATPTDSPDGIPINQAQDQMSKAEKQLNEGQPQPASKSMQDAAQSLRQAADQMAKQQNNKNQNREPQMGNPNLPGPGEAPNPAELAKQLEKHAGKPWGELPGELKSQILQQTRAKYGEEYAKVIKHYFEQLADTKNSPAKP